MTPSVRLSPNYYNKAVQDALRFALSNFTLTFLVLGLMAAGIALLRAPKPLTRPVVSEALLSYFVLFSVGVSFFYNFLAHTVFGAMSARFIGWADSPFQTEVGFASQTGYAPQRAVQLPGSVTDTRGLVKRFAEHGVAQPTRAVFGRLGLSHACPKEQGSAGYSADEPDQTLHRTFQSVADAVKHT